MLILISGSLDYNILIMRNTYTLNIRYQCISVQVNAVVPIVRPPIVRPQIQWAAQTGLLN